MKDDDSPGSRRETVREGWMTDSNRAIFRYNRQAGATGGMVA